MKSRSKYQHSTTPASGLPTDCERSNIRLYKQIITIFLHSSNIVGMFVGKPIKTGGYIMSNFDFMKNAKSFIDAKAESFLKENNVNKPLSDIKKTLNRKELIFKEEEEITANKAEYTVAYINELMTTVLNEVCNKNGTSFEDEYDSFCIHYNSKAD